jgi:chaperone required for assembly of F1-ATPase
MAKRFYQTVTCDEDENGHFIRLDGRALKTPGQKPIRVPHPQIARQIQAEWEAVPPPTDGDINPAKMPVTRLSNVACEGIEDRRDALILEARNYAATDLLSYRAPDPADYVARQSEAWDPWLDWARARHIDLPTTQALQPIEPPEDSLNIITAYAEGLSDYALTLFIHLVAIYGSTILALAVMEQALDPGEAFDLSRLDDLYRAEIWGVDEEDEQTRKALRDETVTLGRLVEYLATDSL